MATLIDLAKIVIMSSQLKSFKFAEIGVFKGDNAVEIINFLSMYFKREEIFYVGFDIFEDLNNYQEEFPEDFSLYDLPEWPYFEFKSGSHSFEKVNVKLGSILYASNYKLIKGDSREKVEKHSALIEDAAMVYIDGCHAYEAVKIDWLNVKKVMNKNQNLIVVFDDSTYEGVARIKNEIALDVDYKIYDLNFNQFFVVSKKCQAIDERFLRAPV